jgi:putative restriction endonuclease
MEHRLGGTVALVLYSFELIVIFCSSRTRMTVSEEYKLEVSPRLKQDYANGRSYYPFHGKAIAVPPTKPLQPNREYLAWHRDHVYAA